MLRQVASRLGSSFVRSIATTAARFEGEAAPAGVKEFTEAWAKTAPSTLGLPEFPTNFLAPESAESAVDGERFSVNFYTPHGLVSQGKVLGSLLTDPDHCCILAIFHCRDVQRVGCGVSISVYFVPLHFNNDWRTSVCASP